MSQGLDQWLERIGHNIRVQRTDKRMTQAVLAAKSGINRSFLGAVERGERNVSVRVLWSLAQVLGVELKTILGETSGQGHEHAL